MPNEEKMMPTTDEKIRVDDILTVDAGDVIKTEEDRENSVWFELRSAFRSHKILSGRIDAMEKTSRGDHLAVVYYKDFRVVIPYEEMNINLAENPALGDINVRREPTRSDDAEAQYVLCADKRRRYLSYL